MRFLHGMTVPYRRQILAHLVRLVQANEPPPMAGFSAIRSMSQPHTAVSHARSVSPCMSVRARACVRADPHMQVSSGICKQMKWSASARRRHRPLSLKACASARPQISQSACAGRLDRRADRLPGLSRARRTASDTHAECDRLVWQMCGWLSRK